MLFRSTPLIFAAAVVVVAETAILLGLVALAERLLLGGDDAVTLGSDGQ